MRYDLCEVVQKKGSVRRCQLPVLARRALSDISTKTVPLRSHGLMTPVKTRRPAPTRSWALVLKGTIEKCGYLEVRRVGTPTKETDMRFGDTRRYDNLT